MQIYHKKGIVANIFSLNTNNSSGSLIRITKSYLNLHIKLNYKI
jgi:hypothetical protein